MPIDGVAKMPLQASIFTPGEIGTPLTASKNYI